jgi:amino acid adenylation domain-containing protein
MDVIEKLFTLREPEYKQINSIIDTSSGAESHTSILSLKHRIRQFAKAFQSDCPSDGRVAILLPKGVDVYCAEIGSLYSGRAFCPLDINYPPERIRYCLSDLSPDLIVTNRSGADIVTGLGFPCMLIDQVDGEATSTPIPGEAAYVIYTSGSTGRPKGIQVSRRSMNKFLEWSWQFYDIRPGDRWAQFSGLGFDLSLVDLLTCVPCGGTLVPVSRDLDRMLPARFIERNQITVWHSVPSMIPQLVQDRKAAPNQLQSLNTATFCGEPFYPQHAYELIDKCPSLRIVNTYGPTEATFFCSAQVVDRQLCSENGPGSLPIGAPIPGWQFEYRKFTDEGLNELVICSKYLSDGYISATPDSNRFSVNQNGVGQYSTGDLVRQEGNHTFFVQRADSQVKVRGNRIDLSEVEFQALEAGVVEAKAFFMKNMIFLAVNLGDVSREDVVERLKQSLPTYAVPADILEFSALPRNVNAKIDQVALEEILLTKWGISQ